MLKIKMPKRTRSGLSIVTAPGRRTVRTFRKRVARRRYARTSRGRVAPKYLFHRWLTTGWGASNVSIAGGTHTTGGNIISTNVTETDVAYNFMFSQLPNTSEFTTLFDQYKINGVMLEFKLVSNPDANYVPTSTTTLQSGNFYPTLWYAPDYDDASTVTLAQIKEFERVKHRVLRPNQSIKVFLRPKTAGLVYRGAVTNGYSVNFKNPWLDLGLVDIPYFGLKYVIDYEGMTLLGTPNDFNVKVNAKFYFACKNVR